MEKAKAIGPTILSDITNRVSNSNNHGVLLEGSITQDEIVVKLHKSLRKVGEITAKTNESSAVIEKRIRDYISELFD